MLRLIRRFGKRAASGIKEEAARREQLKKEHIDTAKEYAQAVKQATSQTANDVKNIITGINLNLMNRQGGNNCNER